MVEAHTIAPVLGTASREFSSARDRGKLAAMASDLLELCAGLALIVPPVAVNYLLFAKDARLRAARFARLADELGQHGFAMRSGSTWDDYGFRGTIDSVPLGIEHYTVERSQMNARRRTTTTSLRFVGLRVEAPAPFGGLRIHARDRVPLTELGAMQEVALAPELGAYRAFVAHPGDARIVTSAAMSELLLALGPVTSFDSTSGAIVLTLARQPAEAALLLRAAELVASLQAERAPAPRPTLPRDPGWESPWVTAAVAPFVFALIAGIPASCAPPVHGAVSPIVCDEGMRIVNRMRNKNPMQCVDEDGLDREPAHLLPILAGASAVYYPSLLVALLWAWRASKRRDAQAGAGGSQHGAAPYR